MVDSSEVELVKTCLEELKPRDSDYNIMLDQQKKYIITQDIIKKYGFNVAELYDDVITEQQKLMALQIKKDYEKTREKINNLGK